MKTPWHLWVIGLISLLWNAGGAFDYVMTKTANAAYVANYTAEQLAYLEAFPAWVSFFWALGVWGAVAGSVLLLLRSRHAVLAFVLSFVGMIVNLVWGLVLSPTPMSAMTGGGFALVFTGAIVVVAGALIIYARAMRTAGVLG